MSEKEIHTSLIEMINNQGSQEDKAQLQIWLKEEEQSGVPTPAIILMRLSCAWSREHTKEYQTPTILKNWKDAMPPNVAVYFFHECDVIAIEEAYFLDFDKFFGERIDKKMIATCYAFKGITGESSCRGVWHQGKKVWDGLSVTQKAKSHQAAKALRNMCISKTIEKTDDFTTGWCDKISKGGVLTCDLEWINFSGKGRMKYLG